MLVSLQLFVHALAFGVCVDWKLLVLVAVVVHATFVHQDGTRSRVVSATSILPASTS
jgi:hypothetical protein